MLDVVSHPLLLPGLLAVKSERRAALWGTGPWERRDSGMWTVQRTHEVLVPLPQAGFLLHLIAAGVTHAARAEPHAEPSAEV